MKKEKYSKMINIPVRQEMLEEILKVCDLKDIPVSVFARDAFKEKLKKEAEK